MNPIINLLIPVKVESYNQYYRIMKNRFVISKSGRKFKDDIINFVKKECPNFECLNCDVKVNLVFGFRDKRRRDIDNFYKALIDSIKGILIKDDSQIFELNSIKKLGQEQDYILMKIWKI